MAEKKGSRLYRQVLVAIALGILLGVVRPEWAVHAKPLGDLFIRLIKLLVAPLVFLTVVTGIAGASNLRKVGRIGLVALVYFEVMTTLALVLGMVVINVVRPGADLHVDPSVLDTRKTDSALQQAHAAHGMDLVPESVVAPFVSGNVLQVLLVALLFGVAIATLDTGRERVLGVCKTASEVVFAAIGLVMRLSPLGAFGAMAATVGTHGVRSLASLGVMMACFYLTSLAFVFFVLGAVCRWIGVSIWRLLLHFRDELSIVLGTSSSESVLPRLMDKLEALGCKPEVVRLVVPTGYSFNLDGTAIYLTMAALFVAQATQTPLSFGQQMQLLLVLLVTSKGAAGVTGSGFVTLTSTLASTGTVPPAGASILLGVDRFMSEARALTNFVGNTVATLAVARFEGALDLERARHALALKPEARADRKQVED